MKGFRVLPVVCALVLCAAASSWAGTGQWLWTVDTNPGSGNLNFSGQAGAATPITLTGVIYNNDSANALSFDGITLKTDELIPNDPGVFSTLFTVDSSVQLPGSYTVPAGGSQPITIGQFWLSSAQARLYKFKVIGAASYDTVAAIPDQITSGTISIDVQPVPEPSTALVLGLGCLLLVPAYRRMLVCS